MNENECEMIEEMAKDLVGEIDYGTADYGDGYDSWTEVYFDYNETAKNMVEKGYRKVADDEIVIKKQQYEQLKKYNRDRKRLRLKWQQAKQETAREILQVLKDNIVNRIGTKYAVIDLTDIAQRAKELGIELEG